MKDRTGLQRGAERRGEEDPPAPAPAAVEEAAPHADERRNRMLAVIQGQAFARVSELSDRFGISEVTVGTTSTSLAGPRPDPAGSEAEAIPRAALGHEHPSRNRSRAMR